MFLYETTAGFSVATFLESADDYNKKVIILIEALIIKLQEFEINIEELGAVHWMYCPQFYPECIACNVLN